MQKLGHFIHHLGSGMIVAGVLWLGISWVKPGWNALSQIFPDEVINMPLALALTVCGMALATLGTRMARQTMATSQAGRSSPKGTARDGTGVMDFGDPGVRRGLKAAKDRLLDAQKTTLGDHFGRAQDRVALRPCWPQRKTGSWVGGLPWLPAEMDWPKLHGQSASFLAQISLSGMPDALWQGAGPRTGWLVVFAHPETSTDVVVRHVVGEVAERAQPADVTHNWHWTTAPQGLQAALGQAGRVPPRWYLEPAASGSLGAVEDMEDLDPGHWDDDIGDYVWAATWVSGRSNVMSQVTRHQDLASGVDWDSLMGMIGIWHDNANVRRDALIEDLKVRKERLEHLRARHRQDLAILSDNPQAEKETHAALRAKHTADEDRFHEQTARLQSEASQIEGALVEAETIIADVKAQAASHVFSPDRGRAVLATLDGLYDGAAAHVRPDTEAFMETYARHLYCQDPALVPDDLLNLFGPLWAKQCRETLIFMGLNAEGTQGYQRPARLIDIPSHPLAGIGFGDESRFYVDLNLADLVQTRWENAAASNTHGGS